MNEYDITYLFFLVLTYFWHTTEINYELPNI